ncbi:hypothetical protein [Acanthopleuribacter pedis]|uniref:Uncharacterized protein n=1 Tax=Acanthopleuribacter pedis TaxID=442870 RepID=A0A8J7U4X0_9BACT|nr:hypothetical protein [Acanthopleuribacter pedis]MBO1321903.1 hypothetical protein [Acanthopleuribacter pedis]
MSLGPLLLLLTLFAICAAFCVGAVRHLSPTRDMDLRFYRMPGRKRIGGVLENMGITREPRAIEELPGVTVCWTVDKQSPHVKIENPDPEGLPLYGDLYQLVIESDSKSLTGLMLLPVGGLGDQGFLMPGTSFDQQYQWVTANPAQVALFHPRLRGVLLHLYPLEIRENTWFFPINKYLASYGSAEDLDRELRAVLDPLTELHESLTRRPETFAELWVMTALDPDPLFRATAAAAALDAFFEGQDNNQTLEDLDVAVRWRRWRELMGLPHAELPEPADTDGFALFWEPLPALLASLTASYEPYARGERPGTTPEARRSRLAQNTWAACDLHGDALMLAGVFFPEWVAAKPPAAFSDTYSPHAAELADLFLDLLDETHQAAYASVLLGNDALRSPLLEIGFSNEPARFALLRPLARATSDVQFQLDVLRFLAEQMDPGLMSLLRDLLPAMAEAPMNLEKKTALIIALLRLIAEAGLLEDLDLVEQCRPHCMTGAADRVAAHAVAAISERAGLPVAGLISPVAAETPQGTLSRADTVPGELEQVSGDTADHNH